MYAQPQGNPTADLRANADDLDSLTGVSGPSRHQIRKRSEALGHIEALAIAALRRYGYERRALKDAKPTRYDRLPGRPTERSRTTLYDARIIRCIDFERVLNAIGPTYSTILQLHYVDGETHQMTALAAGLSTRSAQTLLPQALTALARALDEADLL